MFDETAAVTRRRLFGLGAAVVGATALPSVRAAAAPVAGTYELPIDAGALLPRERLGIQLYTIRNVVASEGFAKVFERLRAIGYTEIEFAGYHEKDPSRVGSLAQLRSLVDASGLRIAGSHMQSSDIDAEIAKAVELGVPRIGVPSINTLGKDRAGWQAQAATWNAWGEKCRAAGLQFYLHNHSAEFGSFIEATGTTRHYDAIVEETDPASVFLEMDVYWAYQGRAEQGNAFEPVDYVLANPGRFILFHVKDGTAPATSALPVPATPGSGYTMKDLGQGTIDYQAFFNAIRGIDADLAKRGYMLEHDNPGQPHGDWRTACTSYGWMAHGLRVAT